MGLEGDQGIDLSLIRVQHLPADCFRGFPAPSLAERIVQSRAALREWLILVLQSAD